MLGMSSGTKKILLGRSQTKPPPTMVEKFVYRCKALNLRFERRSKICRRATQEFLLLPTHHIRRRPLRRHRLQYCCDTTRRPLKVSPPCYQEKIPRLRGDVGKLLWRRGRGDSRRKTDPRAQSPRQVENQTTKIDLVIRHSTVQRTI